MKSLTEMDDIELVNALYYLPVKEEVAWIREHTERIVGLLSYLGGYTGFIKEESNEVKN